MALFFPPCYSWTLKLFMTSGGLLGFYRVGVGDCRPYAWAMVKLSSRCPSGGAVGCAQDGRPPAKEAPLEPELQQIPPVQPRKPLLWGWGGGGWRGEAGRAELQNGSAEPSLLAPRPGWKQELESPTPLSFIEDLKAVLGPQETTRRSLLSSSGHFLPMSFFFFKSLLSIFFTILFLFHVLFFLSLRHMGSELPDQGWDPRPRRWKGNPTTGLSRKFPSNVFSPTSVQGWESGWRKHTTSLSLQHPKHEPHSGKATSHLELEVWVDVMVKWKQEKEPALIFGPTLIMMPPSPLA